MALDNARLYAVAAGAAPSDQPDAARHAGLVRRPRARSLPAHADDALLRWLGANIARFDLVHLHSHVDRLFLSYALARLGGRPVLYSCTLDDSPTQLLEAVMAAGRKGQKIQRYKGLGEMNAEQLWETTLDPDNRALLQVKVEDADVTDEIFTRLMGDVVEPRREFIQDNALNVANLDV